MKTLILSVAAFLTVGFAFAQKVNESEVPKAVIESFSKNFKGMKTEKWEKEKGNEFEAEFKDGKKEMSASFSADGKLLTTEEEIAVSTLPKAIADYVAKNYAGYKISEGSKVDAGGKIMYQAEIQKGKEEMDLIFDDAGNFIKKEVEAEDEKDKD